MDEIHYLFTDFSSQHRDEIVALRFEVFVDEQKVPLHLEIDECDATAVHLVAMLEDRIVGTLRIVKRADYTTIGRLAVRQSFRHKRIATQMINLVVQRVRNEGGNRIELDSQVTVVPFYERFGFSTVGDVFDDAGIPHLKMVLNLTAHRHP